jgi:hypothetical protein
MSRTHGLTGFHNDCFLASNDDSGTYIDVDFDYPYLGNGTHTHTHLKRT